METKTNPRIRITAIKYSLFKAELMNYFTKHEYAGEAKFIDNECEYRHTGPNPDKKIELRFNEAGAIVRIQHKLTQGGYRSLDETLQVFTSASGLGPSLEMLLFPYVLWVMHER